MLQFLSENIATILIAAGLLAVVGLIVANMIKKKKAGKSMVCSNCSDCPSAGACHSQKR